ncbi:MAG: MFS transporter [Parachlamydiales bacterium]|nr:MFS transporter [Parachlamydiales bacterium]
MYTKEELAHQKIGTKVLFIIQLFAIFGYSVLNCTLILYITNALGLDDVIGSTIVASFIAFIYTIRLIGGFISGRFFSHRVSFLIGAVFQLIGFYFLYLYQLYIGLAFFLTGAGISMTSIYCLLTGFYHPLDDKREKAFLWIYSFMNVGFIIGYIISGIFENFKNYKALFAISSLTNLIPILLLIFSWKLFHDKKTHYLDLTKHKKKYFNIFGVLIIIGITTALIWLVKYSFVSNKIIIGFSVIMAGMIIYFALKQKAKIASEKIWAFLILSIMSVIFWTLYTTIPTALTLFIEHNINRMVLGFKIPPQWALNINGIVIVIFGPLLAYFFNSLRKKGYIISVPIQFTLALFLIALSFIVLGISTYFADPKGLISFSWIIISYTLLSFGELFISPISYAMVGKLIPHRLQNIMMGITMLVTGIAAVFANIFSKMAVGASYDTNPLVTNPHFQRVFFIMGLGTVVAGFIMLALVPILHKLIKEKRVFQKYIK